MGERAPGETTFWDETPYAQVRDGARFTRAGVKTTFRGDIEGEGASEYRMAYTDEANASFAGLESVDGRIGERSGAFGIRHDGTFAQGPLYSEWSVIPGSGTGGFARIFGEGRYSNGDGEPTTVDDFEYDFE